MNFSKLDTLLAEYKESGLTTTQVSDESSTLIKALITKDGESPWKAVNELSFVQLGVLTNMVKEYVQRTY